MKKEFHLCCLVAAILPGGCAKPYRPAGGTGGYVDRKIDDQTNHIQFSGNGYTPRDKVHKYFMYRCAKLTRQTGFRYLANKNHGLGAFSGSTWSRLFASDVGDGFIADCLLSFTDRVVIHGDSIRGGTGTTAAGGITTVRAPSTTRVVLGQHLGLTTWWWG